MGNVCEKVLISDDEVRIVRTFARQLGLMGFTVLTASDDAQAIQIYMHEQPDITLVGACMLGTGGFDVLQAIREHDSQAEVIMITASGDMEMAVEALRAGASDFVPQQVDNATLKVIVQRAQERLCVRRELHATRDALRATETRYRTLVEQLPAIIYIVEFGEVNKTTYISPQVESFLGFSQTEWLADPDLWIRQIHPDDREWVLTKVRENDAKGEPLNLEYRVLTRGGRVLWIRNRTVLSQDDVGEIRYVQGFMSDISEHKRAEEVHWLHTARLEALHRLNQMQQSSLQEITDFALEEAVRLTDSEIGYLAFLNEDETVLTMHSWSKTAMAECAITDKPIHYPVKTTGLWGEAVRQRRPIVTNDYATLNPWKRGYPAGHVAIQRHMNVPVFSGDRIVIVAGVGNKPAHYNDQDVQQLTLLMEGMWRMIERQRAEKMLRANEAKYRSLIEQSNDAIYLLYDGHFELVNPRFETLFEITAEEACAPDFNFLFLVAPQSRPMIEERYRKVAAGQEVPSRYEFTALSCTGKEFEAEVSVSHIAYRDGLASQGILRDVSERKKMEQALRESEMRFRELADLLPQAVYEIDVDGNLTYTNQQALVWFDYAQQDVERGVNVFQMLAPEERERAQQTLHEIASGVPIKNGREYLALRQDGSTFPIRLYASPIIRQGQIAGFRGIIGNITTQKRVEQARRRQQATVVALVQHRAFAVGDLTAAARFLTESVVEALDVPRASVWLLEDNGKALRCHDLYLRDNAVHQTGDVLTATDFPAYFAALREGRVIEAHDAHHDSRTCEFSAVYLTPNNITSMLDATIRFSGTMVGVVCLEHVGELREWQVDEVTFVGEVADQFAQALANAERQRDQDRLRASEEKYRSLIEKSIQGVVVAQDNPIRLRFASQPMQAICGFSPQELTAFDSQRLATLIYPEDRELFFKNFRARLVGEPVSPRHEYRIVHKNKGVRWVEIYSSLIEYEGESATQTIFLDITERKRAEEALRISLEKYRVLFETFPLGITISDNVGNIVEMNRASEQLLGLSVAEHGERRIDGPEWEIIRPDGSPMPAEEYASVRALSENCLVENVELGVIKPGNDTVWLNVTAAPIPLEGYGVAVTYGDITARVHAQNARRESEERYRMLFERSTDAIFLVDRRTGSYLETNEAAEALTGRSVDELRQLTVRDVIPETVRERFPQFLATTQTLEVGEVHYVRPNGVTRTALLDVVPLNEQTVFSIARDITEYEEMEQRLRRQQQLAAVGQLAAGIAHDFRNLLTTIILYAQLGRRKPDLAPKVAQYLDIIVGESYKATDLVQQILDFSRRTTIDRRPLDLVAFVRDVVAVFRRTLPENIRVVLDVEPGACVVEGDTGRLQQALTNLALNASDAMPSGGTLRISVTRVTVVPGASTPLPDMPELTEPQTWICLCVVDTGTGMDEDVRAHLFEPFFSTKREGQGTGLGLAQVYGIVRLHAGYIDVQTEVGKGTTFCIYLPAATLPVDDETESSVPAPPGQGETLLLVEDNAILREAGRSMLVALGYRVLTAANGREALAIYRTEGPIALLITDLVMPEMGGKALLETLLTGDPDLKALAVTGYTAGENAETLQAAGFLASIRKPFDAEVLAQTVRRILDEV